MFSSGDGRNHARGRPVYPVVGGELIKFCDFRLSNLNQAWNGVLPTTMVPGSSVPFVSVK